MVTALANAFSDAFDDSIEQQFKDLIKESHDFVRAARESDHTLPPATTAEVAAWVTRCGQLITLLSPNTSEYYQQYARALRSKNFYRIDRTNYRHLILIEGAVTALYDDYRRAIGEPPARIAAVWLIAVSLFQHGRGQAEFAEIALTSGGERLEVVGK